jgi:MoaA/NifB/PqqE/SkfB family radical SAM enzyme
MSVSEIGFYTLTDDRAKLEHTNLERCEMILTEACNFKCPYCRGVESYSRDCSGHMDYKVAQFTLNYWIDKGLKNIRFSGGEPTLYPYLGELIELAREGGIERIAISTNGSMHKSVYKALLILGVNDFSISLDACCAEDSDKMAGREGYFDTVVENIRWLSQETYVTVGLVFTDERASEVASVVEFAASLGVSDIRIISAAQYDGSLLHLEKIDQSLLDKYPVLNYRVSNLINGRNVRGMKDSVTNRCYLVRDDYAVAGKWHFPCVIHMREGGEPIGEIGDNMQDEREVWSRTHDTHSDPICMKNCLDCLVDYNNLAIQYREEK